ncbi:MAG: hypothetical protein QXQ70_04910 [Candidatus Caldarchaeum sp.]
MQSSPVLALAEPVEDREYEIHGVCRGIGLRIGGVHLVGEGMGIGGVIGIAGRKAVFPLKEETANISHNILWKRYYLNGLSIKYWGGVEVEKPYKKLREMLSPLYIRHSGFRPFYTLLMAGRTLAGLKSRYIAIDPVGTVETRYKIDGNSVDVEVSVDSPRDVVILVANELSGRLFTAMEIGGRIRGVPPWLEVRMPVRFIAPSIRLSMALEPVDGCRMFVGREVLGNRLDWAGASYQLSKDVDKLCYRVVFDWWT